jgi:hypothetical protein
MYKPVTDALPRLSLLPPSLPPSLPHPSQEVKYHQWLEGLDLMLKHYYEVIGQLTPIERELLGECVRGITTASHTSAMHALCRVCWPQAGTVMQLEQLG